MDGRGVDDPDTPNGSAAYDAGRRADHPDEEPTQRHLPFSSMDANAQLTRAVARALEGDLVGITRAIEALPAGHPRRRLLLSNLMQATALLQDLPGILAR